MYGWLEGNGLRAVLSLTRHQSTIHCKSSRVAYGHLAHRQLLCKTLQQDLPVFRKFISTEDFRFFHSYLIRQIS